MSEPRRVGLMELLMSSTGCQFVIPVYQRNYSWGEEREVKQYLNDNGVATGMHYGPNHLRSLFAVNQDNATLKHTDEIYEQLITLPLHADMNEEDVMYVCETLKKAL